MKRHLIYISLILLTGCSSHNLANKPTMLSGNNKQAYEQFSDTVLLVADNQKALILTEPIFEQSKLSEKTVNTAHRRAALDEFSLDILKYINKNSSSKLIIHAGDVLNNSCVGEFEEIVQTFNSFDKPWYIAPGNHDGFYLGISSPMRWSRNRGFRNPLLNERNGWAQVCTPLRIKPNTNTYEKRSKMIMDKYSYVQSYIDSIDIKNSINSNIVNTKFDSIEDIYNDLEIICKSAVGDYSIDNSRRGFLKSICWTQKPNNNNLVNLYEGEKDTFTESKPWRHFVVQLLKIPFNENEYINVLVIDSANYNDKIAVDKNGDLIAKGYGAADNAYFSQTQTQIANNWVNNDRIDLVIGHHPLEDFTKDSLERIVNIIQKTTNKLYVSGDTHDGYDVQHYQLLTSKQKIDIREANLGSLIDAPLEYAILGFSNNSGFNLERKSLTPLTVNKLFWNSSQKKSSYNNYKKNYATIDTLWHKCEQAFGEYQKNVPPSSPLQLSTNSTYNYTLKQPSSYATLPYILYVWNYDIVRNKSMKVYKINRLLNTVSVYESLYKYSGFDDGLFAEQYKKLKVKLKDSVERLHKDNFISYFGTSMGLFDSILNNASALIIYLRENTPSNSQAVFFKQCSAIFEAEREYRP